MKQQLTVYLDTSFYVRLCKADGSLATQTIQALNELNVRHVISDVLIRELLTSKDRTDGDEALVKRVNQFRLSPYSTRGGLAWNVLLLSGQDRVFVADTLRNLHDAMTKATSFAIMAQRDTNTEQAAKLREAGKPVLQQFGFPEDFEQNKTQVLAAMKSMMEFIGIQNIDWPEHPSSEDIHNVSEQLKLSLGPFPVALLEEERLIQDSSTKSEDRPYQVAVGTASNEAKRKLGNTLRDTEHIMAFISHRNEIDLLQVDKPHEEIIKRPKPQHRLAELGLANRCFSADSLPAVVDKVRELQLHFN